ncbi:MAG: WbuC family cupin fold metalloprotein [Bacteroidaceae bacterium]|nr:WbuC family cupin fold metalloprotein [Bacteroidaceae bacterium]
MKIIDNQLMDSVTAQAKQSPRLRMNYNFHQSLEDKCHRFLNAMEMGTQVAVHHHITKDETLVVLRGKVRVLIYNDEGDITENEVIDPKEGRFGVDIPKNTWHTVECMEPGTVVFEVKEGPFVPHEIDGILEVKK